MPALGAVFKGCRDSVVRDIVIRAHKVRIRRELWLLPDGTYRVGERPPEFAGLHFGPALRAYVLHPHHQCLVTQLLQIGVAISVSELDRLLTRDLDLFKQEQLAVLQAGLKASPVFTVDDTCARHKGKNGYATNVSGPAFAYFSSTESKSRASFLELLHAGNVRYAINDAAVRYMAEHGLAPERIAVLRQHGKGASAERTLLDKLLTLCGITAQDQRRIAVEGALWGGLAAKVHTGLAVVSDGAGQFNAGSTHGMCWVHAERLVHKLITGDVPELNAAQCLARGQIWALFGEFKRYKLAPTPDEAWRLSAEFDQIFTQKTCFTALNKQLEWLNSHKDELLLILKRPEAPLHTNQSETDIRDYVRKRKVSGGTRSDRGRECWDAFATLKKTCRKLGVSFWGFLEDRLGVPPATGRAAVLICLA